MYFIKFKETLKVKYKIFNLCYVGSNPAGFLTNLSFVDLDRRGSSLLSDSSKGCYYFIFNRLCTIFLIYLIK